MPERTTLEYLRGRRDERAKINAERAERRARLDDYIAEWDEATNAGGTLAARRKEWSTEQNAADRATLDAIGAASA